MKRMLAVLLVLIAIWPLPGAAFAKESEEKADTVIVYNQETGLDAIKSLAESFGKTVDALHTDWLYAGALDDYSYVILLNSGYLDEASKTGKPLICIGGSFAQNGVSEINAGLVNFDLGGLRQKVSVGGKMAVLTSPGDESFGSVTDSFGNQYPFAKREGKIWTVPYFNRGDISLDGLGGVMQKFFGWQGTPQLYVMIDEVYAFSDLDLFKKTADALCENGFPFIVRVMPVYDNTDYPAFKRWAQLLRYVQSRGGSIVLHDAIVQPDMEEKVPLDEMTDKAKKALLDEKVNLYELSPGPYPVDFSFIENTSSPTKQFAGLNMNAMVVYSLPKDDQGIADMVAGLNRAWLTVSDYKRNYTDESPLYNETPYDQAYQYVKEEEQTYREFFTVGNNLLIVVVGGSIVVLAVLFVLGRHLYRKKFLRKRGGS
jgi:hypothetical protein